MRIEIQKDSYLIENGIVQKRYTVQKNRLRSFSLTHCQSQKELAFNAESELFVLRFQGAFGGEYVKAGELKILDAHPEETDQSVALVITFKPFKIRGCKLQIRFEETLGAFDHYLQSRLVFSAEPGTGDSAILDYIDFAPLALREGANVWTAPQSAKNKADAESVLRLGQPVFYENCFFGCAFPAANSGVQRERLFVRRYYGRSLFDLLGPSGCFCSDNAVCGAGANAEFLSVRERFFAYIEKISLPAARRTALQLQTDLMDLDSALLQTEKSWQNDCLPFAQTVMLPMHQAFPDLPIRSFPNTLPASLLALQKRAAALGASLGLQIGADRPKAKGLLGLSKHKPGSKEEVCPADGSFLQKLQTFLRLCIENGITSFFFDLPFLRPCRDSTHDHARGGEKQLYFYTDLWEKWINLLSDLRRTSSRPLHFVLHGAPLSPWLLQYADSVALPQQSKKELSRLNLSERQKLLDAERFYCLKTLSLCFPQNRLHASQLLDQKAADSLAAIQTAYAADSICAGDRLLIATPSAAEKAAQALRGLKLLLKEAEPVLRGGVMFGGDPASDEPYGFSAFSGACGILVLHNPGSLAATFSFKLDEQCGVPKQLSAVGLCSLLPLTAQTDSAVRGYGDLISQDLAPGETVVLQLGRRKQPVSITCVPESERTLRVICNQPLDFSAAVCEENALQKIEQALDPCVTLLQFAYPFHTGNELRLHGVRDLLLNETDLTLRFAAGTRSLLPSGAIKGTGPFSIRVTIGGEANADFYMQGTDVGLQSRSGYVVFRVGKVSLHARAAVADTVQICAVRENTGALKLYLNQQLDCGILPTDEPTEILPAVPLCFDPNRTKLFDRALGYDEV